MYQMRQAIQLLNVIEHLCLERDVQRLKCQHFQWSEIDVLRNLMKLKLPPSIPLTPQWHHTQFKELLMMLENFRMLHFFLTLTSNETSNLRWKEIKLFCTRLQVFMSIYVLSGENILGVVEYHVT
jgi:hypothetical protein